MSDKKIIQEDGENILPITHETCVLDDEGNPITETIGDVSLLNTESRNLVGAVNEVFGNIIKEQVVDVLVDNGVEAITSESWSGLIEKIDTGLENISKIEETRNKLVELMQSGGYEITGEEDIDSLLEVLTLSGLQISGIKQIACGNGFTFVLNKDDSLWSCGYNYNLQLGLEHRNSNKAFAQVNINNVKFVCCGDQCTFVLKNDGTLWGCGSNSAGQFGNGTTNGEYSKFTSLNVNNVKQIACTGSSIYVVKNDNSLWVCGLNNQGQLGLGHKTNITAFTQVTSIGNTVKEVISGTDHVFIIKNDGTLWGCGNNTSGALGLGNKNEALVFTQVITNINNDIKQVICGYSYSFIIKTDGTLWGCGDNYYGVLGFNDTTTRTTFTQVTSMGNDNKEAHAFYVHSFVIKNDGSLWGCGYNETGQLGLGNTTKQYTTFQQVTTNINNDVKQVICGGGYLGGNRGFTYILKNDGSILSTGHNSNGELGLNNSSSPITTFTAVPKGFTY